MPNSSEAMIDYDSLMQANLLRVFGERDSERRFQAIRDLYAEDAVLNEPHVAAKGHIAISQAVTTLHASLPPDVVFTPSGPAVGHHGIGCLHWRCSSQSDPAVAIGMDIAQFQNGQIHSLTVLLISHGA